MLEEISDMAVAAAPAAPAAIAPSRAARGAQAAVAVLFLVNGAAIGSWVPHIPERAQVLGLNAAQLGSVLLAGGIGALCAMPFSAPLLRRTCSRTVAVASGLLFPALLTLAILLPSVPLLVGVLFLVGLNAAAMDVAMNAHGVLVEGVLRRRTISLFHAVFSVGCFAGAGLHSVLMARHVPDRILVPSFGAVLLLLVLSVAPLLLPKRVEDAQHAAERPPMPAASTGRTGWRALLPAKCQTQGPHTTT